MTEDLLVILKTTKTKTGCGNIAILFKKTNKVSAQLDSKRCPADSGESEKNSQTLCKKEFTVMMQVV